MNKSTTLPQVRESQLLSSKRVEDWSVFIVLIRKNSADDKEILLVLNTDIKGDKWGLPGGRIEKPEINRGIINTITALGRELREEAGLDLEKINLDFNFRNRNLPYVSEKQSWHCDNAVARVIVFYAEWNGSDDLRPSPDADADVTEARWFPVNQFPENLYKSHRIRIHGILQTLKN
ncbi:MAG: NUDIX hydrolase [Patescibacteria group bacterium]